MTRAISITTPRVSAPGAAGVWRGGVLALLVLMPFSGIPVFLAGTPGLLFRDALVVLPLYAAFAIWSLRATEPIIPPLGIAMPALALFAALAIAHTLVSPSITAAAIGTKVWLAYIPMLAVGYCYVRTDGDLDRALRLTALLALIPAALAIAECAIASRGEHATDPKLLVNDFGPFRYLYGGWYEHVRHSVVSFYAPHGRIFVIARVPSTFTAGTQYACFALVAFAAGLGQALRSGDRRWAACAAVLAAGAIASGARLTYLAVPAIAVVGGIVAGAPSRYWLAFAGGAMLLAVAAIVAGADVIAIARLIPGHLHQQSATAWHELSSALSTGVIGHGTGWDTNAALRYGDVVESRYIENWYAKGALELGLVGLAAAIVALASLHARLLIGVARLHHDARLAAAPVAAMLAIVTLALFKGPYIDLDPLNVYFWLFAGMLLALIRIESVATRRKREGA